MTDTLAHRTRAARLTDVTVPELIRSGDGDSLLVITPLAVKVRPGQTHCRAEIHEQQIPPRVLIPPHRHDHQDQWSYVVSGQLGCLVGTEEHILGPGDCIWRPAGIPHAIWNPGPATAVMLEVSTPGDQIMQFFAEVDELTRSGQLTQERMAQLAAPYGITYFSDLQRDLETRHAVSPAAGQWQTTGQGVG
jgi:uncharacterized cupin superfamily protein